MVEPVVDGGDSIEALYRRNVGALRRLGYLMTGSRAIGDELVQEAFLRLHERRDRVREPAAYVRTVLVHLAMRSSTRSSAEARHLRSADDLVAWPGDVDETWALLERLPQAQRVVVVLRYYDDLAAKDIAHLVGCSTATVRTRLHRALRSLRKEMTT